MCLTKTVPGPPWPPPQQSLLHRDPRIVYGFRVSDFFHPTIKWSSPRPWPPLASPPHARTLLHVLHHIAVLPHHIGHHHLQVPQGQAAQHGPQAVRLCKNHAGLRQELGQAAAHIRGAGARRQGRSHRTARSAMTITYTLITQDSTQSVQSWVAAVSTALAGLGRPAARTTNSAQPRRLTLALRAPEIG